MEVESFMGLFQKTKDDLDATRPINDRERFIAGVYAIWSEYCGGSSAYLGGYVKTKSNAKLIRGVLKEDWLIKDHDSGVEMIEYLLNNAGADNNCSTVNVAVAAFDYACACNLCGRMFIAGYFTREESIDYAIKAAKLIQEHYYSWDEFYDNYIAGAAKGSNIKERAPFETAYEQVKIHAQNPLQLAWDTKL